MDALLILGGLLLILGGSLWLISRAFSVSLFWGLGSLLPPLTLAFALFKWRKASGPVTLAAMGFIPLVVGLVMLAHRDSERLDAILSMSWFEPKVRERPELDMQLYGELDGQPFLPVQGELIEGVLSLRERVGPLGGKALSIRLPKPVASPMLINVLPQDQGPLPQVEIKRSALSLGDPQSWQIEDGYTLYINLEPKPPNLLVGELHLTLPEQFHTSLSGRVELYSNRLRYRDGRVDAHFDSDETLAHVIEDYLARRFATDAVSLLRQSQAVLPATHVDIDVLALVNGKRQHFLLGMVKDERRGWRVEDDRFPQRHAEPPRQVAIVGLDKQPQAPMPVPVDRKELFSLQALQAAPGDYRQARMYIATRKGGTVEGLFEGIDESGHLIIRRSLGAGGASYRLSPKNVQSIELLEP